MPFHVFRHALPKNNEQGGRLTERMFLSGSRSCELNKSLDHNDVPISVAQNKIKYGVQTGVHLRNQVQQQSNRQSWIFTQKEHPHRRFNIYHMENPFPRLSIYFVYIQSHTPDTIHRRNSQKSLSRSAMQYNYPVKLCTNAVSYVGPYSARWGKLNSRL